MKHLLQILLLSGFAHAGETLPNGIVLPDEWPPRIGGYAGKPPLETFSKPGDPPEPPYLKTKPAVIDIDVGRQLFVDDFLIAETNLKRVWHQPVKHTVNPVLKPDKAWELGITRTPMAAPFSDGCFYDPQSKRFMLWYSSGWYDSTALAVSGDGLQWERPVLDVFPGTNKVMLRDHDEWRRDTASIWLDHEATRPDERFKATMFCRSGALGTKLDNYNPGLLLLASPDGIHWTLRGQTKHSKDNTTMFYNPFRKVWVFSHRIHIQHPDGRYERARAYWETKDFFSAGGEAMKEKPPVYWMSEQSDDVRETTKQASAAIELGNSTLAQIYKIDATPYESLMLGLFEILSGPTNDECAAEGKPKRTDLQLAFSRDGFHWSRHRETFIGGTGKAGDWDRGYISSVGGGCLIVGDELLFPYGAFAGNPANTDKYYVWGGLYANGATGIAKLRRDGQPATVAVPQRAAGCVDQRTPAIELRLREPQTALWWGQLQPTTLNRTCWVSEQRGRCGGFNLPAPFAFDAAGGPFKSRPRRLASFTAEDRQCESITHHHHPSRAWSSRSRSPAPPCRAAGFVRR